MKMFKKFLTIGALLCAAVACVPLVVNAQPGVESDILFGGSLVLSGPSEILGQELQAGERAYFARVNESGGVDGHHVALVTLDDHYEPNAAVTNTQKLIREQHIFAAMGYVGTPTTLAALPELSAAGVPLIGAFTGAKGLREPFNRFMFNTRASYNDEGVPLAKQLAVYGKVALFVQDDAYGKAVQEAVTAGLAKYGLAPVVVVTIKRNVSGPEFQASIDRAADAIAKSGAAAVAVGSVYAPVSALMQALKDRGAPTVMASVSFIGTTGVLQTMQRSAAGMGIVQVVPSPFNQSTELTRQFTSDMAAWREQLLRQAHAATSKDEVARLTKLADYAVPSYGAMEGYINARVAVEGLRHCHGTFTRERFIEGLEDLGRFDLGGFVERYSKNSHLGSTFTDLTVVSTDGKKVVQ
jgi:ABC-type branched-subunit amino acid transport system substrate-binding protein